MIKMSKINIISRRNFNMSYKNCNLLKHNSSKSIRTTFLDYFVKEHNHKFVRSSPVLPFYDPTVAFVNAGMIQFKSIFLGHQTPLYNKVANSQKCVRVGGKHNDLNVVGTDTYHHTFFEMLGNWSFGSYFKKEACEMAWNLLTGPYKLNPAFLYVTYFAGDPKMNLEPDLECKDIWRTIGVAENHILPFGSSENFWEMGPTGPCGPCSEIHIDRTKSNTSRAHDVNKGLSDLIELWNIVFIQYNRNVNGGSITPLSQYHIDTGMGLERLSAVLQEKNSNYDTDIFTNLMDSIHKKCKGIPKYRGQFGENDKKGIDTAYRILADHSRMIAVCLADGFIPEENQKLRRILRKSMHLAETVFRCEKGLLNELATVTAQDLGCVYPEIEKNLKQIHEIINYEEDVYKSIRSVAVKDWQKILKKEPKLKNLNILEMPGLVLAYNELTSLNTTLITPQLAFKLYDTYGLDHDTLSSLSQTLHLQFDSNDLLNELELAKQRTKYGYLSTNQYENVAQILAKNQIAKTDDHYKYSYYKTENGLYNFDNISASLLQIVNNNGCLVNEIAPNVECSLILNKTNFYSESGGQESDIGHIEFSNQKIFHITTTQYVNGYLFHKGVLKAKDNLKLGDNGIVITNNDNRLKIMRNHTATHLINAALKLVIQGTTCQKSSKVTSNSLSFDVGVYTKKKLAVNDIVNIENVIRDVIKSSVNVECSVINSQQLLSMDNVTLIPGEIYPDVGIRLIRIQNEKFYSCEPCCGTHVSNTSDIQDLSIVNFKSLGRSTTSLTAVTGENAIHANRNGKLILDEIFELRNKLNDDEDSVYEISDLRNSIIEFKRKLNNNSDEKSLIPASIKIKCLELLNDFNKQLRNVERDSLREFIDLEMKSVRDLNANESYIVHFLGCSSILDNVPLQRATKICSDIPVIVISYSDDIVKARCCVPQNLIGHHFNAQLWLENSVAQVFESSTSAPKNQDATLVCNMKAKKINKLEWDTVLDRAITAAKTYANLHFK